MILSLIENLKNGSAKSLAVNGSSSSQTFSYAPGDNNVALVYGLNCVLDDPGTSSFNKFGSLTALTNGVLIQTSINSTLTTVAILKDNADLSTVFSDCHFGSTATDTLGGAVGFGDSYDSFCGRFRFAQPILLKGSDTIQVVVQDNLSGLTTFQISCSFCKEV